MTWLLVTRYPLVAQRWRSWASSPGIHIAQFPFQVIGNCGVILLMQRSKSAVWVSTDGTTVAIAGWRGAQYDGIVAFVACGNLKRGPGGGLMIVVMLISGIACLLAGLLAIGLGIPVKEFSFGNTLILAGAVAACTGLVVLALWVVVRELQNIARRLGQGKALDGTALPTAAAPR